MTEIPPSPTSDYCARCTSQVVWLYSSTKEAWVAFIPCSCGTRWALQPHPCRSAQDPATWRSLPHGSPPTEDYLEAKSKIKSATKETDG